jgi:hypothetical protein
MNLRENWPKIKEILDVLNSDFWNKLEDSDGGYAAFLAGQVFGFIAISVMTGTLSGLNKLGKFLRFIGFVGIAGKKAKMKLIATMSDGYEFLTNPEIHEKLLRVFHKKLPELGLVNLREGLEAMIMFTIALPPNEQSMVVEALLEFVASGDLKKLQENEHLKKWISMWLQREQEKEEISVGTNLWDKRYDEEENLPDQSPDIQWEEDFWTSFGLMDLRDKTEGEVQDRFLDEYMKILETDKKTIRNFTYENREKVRKLILDETPFGWRVNFRHLMPGIVSKLQAYVGLGDLFNEDELPIGFTVTYPNGYHGKKALIANTRKGRKYLNKEDKYLAIFDDCDIII